MKDVLPLSGSVRLTVDYMCISRALVELNSKVTVQSPAVSQELDRIFSLACDRLGFSRTSQMHLQMLDRWKERVDIVLTSSVALPVSLGSAMLSLRLPSLLLRGTPPSDKIASKVLLSSVM